MVTTKRANTLPSAAVTLKTCAFPVPVSGMVTFLCSDYSSYISGSSITIDGGLLTDSAIGVKRG